MRERRVVTGQGRFRFRYGTYNQSVRTSEGQREIWMHPCLRAASYSIVPRSALLLLLLRLLLLSSPVSTGAKLQQPMIPRRYIAMLSNIHTDHGVPRCIYGQMHLLYGTLRPGLAKNLTCGPVIILLLCTYLDQMGPGLDQAVERNREIHTDLYTYTHMHKGWPSRSPRMFYFQTAGLRM